jgi:Fe-S cluster biogenesis protein NfuA
METRPVTVVAQKTPNPLAYKFATSLQLVPEGAYEIRRADSPTEIPFIDTLFERWPVERVYVAANFFTLATLPEADWQELSLEVRDYLAVGLREGQYEPGTLPQRFQIATWNGHPGLHEFITGRILPATEQDGGGIFLHGFAEGVLQLAVAGACHSCPYAQQTIEQGIVEPLNKGIVRLKKVQVLEAARA